MRSQQPRAHSSRRHQTLQAVAAAALSCGLAVSTASAQSMGSFGRADGNSSNGGNQQQQQDNRRNAPQSQPVSAPPARVAPPQVYMPVRVAPPQSYSPPQSYPSQSYSPVRSAPPQTYMPVRVAPPATAGGGYGQSYGSANSQVPYGGERRGGAPRPPSMDGVNPPAHSGAIFGTNRPARGVDAGGSVNNSNAGGQGDFRSGVSRREGVGVGSTRGATRQNYGSPGVTTYESTSSRLNDGYGGRQPIRVTTPQGQRDFHQDRGYDRDRYVYGSGTTVITNGPVLLGGYYYGNYCDYGYGQNVYPSVYTVYGGFPQYICNPSVIIVSQPYYPIYTTSYLPFYQPAYQVTYNETNYYVTSEERASEIREGGETAREAVKSAYKEGSYQAAFADIAEAWKSGNIAPLHKHLRDNETKVSILLKRKYAYSIASNDFEQITRDALDRLNTVSFKFTRLRKAKNGDVTAYGKHVYRVSDDAASAGAVKDSDTVPFDASSDQPYDQSGDPSPGEEKVVYVAYTLRHKDDLWYIIAVNSSPKPLVTSDENQDDSAQ